MTSEPKWTAGPWSYQFKTIKDDWGEIRDSDGRLVAKCVFGRWRMQDLEAHRKAKTDPSAANARLIAAAPELYEALVNAKLQIEYLHDKFQATGSGMSTLAKIDAALKKARGE